MVFGGDFRQTLPVVPDGSRQDVVGASLCRSKLWTNIEVHFLTRNMRLEEGNAEHAQWLLQIGVGATHNVNDSTVQLPHNMCCANLGALIDSIYSGIGAQQNDQYFLNRTILCPRNDEVDALNQTLLDKFPGDTHLLMSVDS